MAFGTPVPSSVVTGAGHDPVRKNPGYCPAEAQGKRVHVVLRNGYDTRGKEPAGWAATDKGACRWTLTGHPFDIEEFEVIG